MCNKRNNTWKNFVENGCKFESLADTITESKLTYEIRSIICSLLNKVINSYTFYFCFSK